MEVWDIAEADCALMNHALDEWFWSVETGSSRAQKKAVETIAPELTSLFTTSKALSEWKSAMLSAIDEDAIDVEFGTVLARRIQNEQNILR